MRSSSICSSPSFSLLQRIGVQLDVLRLKEVGHTLRHRLAVLQRLLQLLILGGEVVDLLHLLLDHRLHLRLLLLERRRSRACP